MRKALIMTLAGVASLAAFSSAANARDGCGHGWHRNYYGHCRPNDYGYRDYGPGDRTQVVIAPEVGRYYPDRGYWDGDRYYWHRSRTYDGWRYW
jgi:hypothetical protein